jgi:aspartate 1-decarboxylase
MGVKHKDAAGLGRAIPSRKHPHGKWPEILKNFSQVEVARACAYTFRLMQIHLLKSKIHRATVTGGNVNYEGSLTVSADLMEKVGLQEYERILCGNMANGNRFETYVIRGKRGSGEIIMNGAVAFLGKKGDLLTIMNFAVSAKPRRKNGSRASSCWAKETRLWTNAGFEG